MPRLNQMAAIAICVGKIVRKKPKTIFQVKSDFESDQHSILLFLFTSVSLRSNFHLKITREIFSVSIYICILYAFCVVELNINK